MSQIQIYCTGLFAVTPGDHQVFLDEMYTGSSDGPAEHLLVVYGEGADESPVQDLLRAAGVARYSYCKESELQFVGSWWKVLYVVRAKSVLELRNLLGRTDGALKRVWQRSAFAFGVLCQGASSEVWENFSCRLTSEMEFKPNVVATASDNLASVLGRIATELPPTAGFPLALTPPILDAIRKAVDSDPAGSTYGSWTNALQYVAGEKGAVVTSLQAPSAAPAMSAEETLAMLYTKESWGTFMKRMYGYAEHFSGYVVVGTILSLASSPTPLLADAVNSTALSIAIFATNSVAFKAVSALAATGVVTAAFAKERADMARRGRGPADETADAHARGVGSLGRPVRKLLRGISRGIEDEYTGYMDSDDSDTGDGAPPTSPPVEHATAMSAGSDDDLDVSMGYVH